ncbi:OmpH family outer membrane protein [Thermoproteota archaeon]
MSFSVIEYNISTLPVTGSIEVDSKTRELQDYQRGAEMELMKDRDERLKEILKDIQDVIAVIAKKEGYDYILNDRVLLYKNESMDISEQILKQLNDNLKK